MSRSGARVVSARVRGRGYKLSSRRESRLYNCCCAPYALLDRGTLRRRRAPVAMLGVAYCAAGRRGGRLFSVVFGWRRARCCCCRLLLAGRQLIRPVLPTAPITDCQHWNLASSAHVFRGGCACLGIDCSISTAPRAEKYLNRCTYGALAAAGGATAACKSSENSSTTAIRCCQALHQRGAARVPIIFDTQAATYSPFLSPGKCFYSS